MESLQGRGYVSRGYYSLTYLFSYLLISRLYRVPTQSVVNKEAKSLALALKAKSLALRVVALTPSLIDSRLKLQWHSG